MPDVPRLMVSRCSVGMAIAVGDEHRGVHTTCEAGLLPAALPSITVLLMTAFTQGADGAQRVTEDIAANVTYACDAHTDELSAVICGTLTPKP